MPEESIVIDTDTASVVDAGVSEVVVLQDAEVQVVDTNPFDTVIVYEPEIFIVETGTGPRGEPGLDGAGLFYRYIQATPSVSWTVVHNLGEYLNVTVVDTANVQIEATVTYLNPNTIRIDFSAPIAGEAYIS